MGDKALGVTEITTDLEFYDYEAKYAAGGSEPHPAGARFRESVTRGGDATGRSPRTRRWAAAASRAPISAMTTRAASIA